MRGQFKVIVRVLGERKPCDLDKYIWVGIVENAHFIFCVDYLGTGYFAL
jgi:hypothetical protein